MPSDPHKKRFLNLPKYPGGSSAYKEFITSNLKYPEEAIAANVEGSVHVEFEITDEGKVVNPRVLKGIGHGCNEEAIRLVGLLQYEKVKNRGVRVKITTKTTINFKLPGIRITYSSPEKPAQKKDDTKGPASYEYTVSW
jgi:TonB family protein